MITRRLFLRNTAAAGAVGAAVAAPVAAEAAILETPQERVARLIEELKVSIPEAYPSVSVSKVMVHFDDPSFPLPMMFVTQWRVGFYDGDGIYMAHSEWRDDERYMVKLLDYPIDGQRGFSVIEVRETRRSKWMYQSESELESFIGAKIQGGAA